MSDGLPALRQLLETLEEGGLTGEVEINISIKLGGKKPKRVAPNIPSKEFADQVEQIYAAYPRRVGKNKAIPAIRLALKKVKFEYLLERVKLYAKTMEGMGVDANHPNWNKVVYPQGWFNQERWAFEPAEWTANFRGDTQVTFNLDEQEFKPPENWMDLRDKILREKFPEQFEEVVQQYNRWTVLDPWLQEEILELNGR